MDNNDTRIKYIDGMRGVAAMIVVFNHLITGF
jgi:peptidoglycan/LPS O-acetylase OafA/YrhL